MALIKSSMLFSLDFANNTILSWFFFFFLIIDLYFLIPAIVAQFFNPIAESVQYNIEFYKSFCAFYSPIHFSLFLQGNNFLFHLYILI